MHRLSDNQILSTLMLNEVFPEIIWFTEVRGTEIISIVIKEDSTLEEALYAVSTIFPSPSLEKFSTKDNSFYIWSMGECVGSLYMPQKEKPLLQTEAVEETVHPQCIVNVTKVQSLLEPWYVEQIFEERRVRK